MIPLALGTEDEGAVMPDKGGGCSYSQIIALSSDVMDEAAIASCRRRNA